MSEFHQTSHHYLWQGRDDKEDGELGTRVHHVVQNTPASELKNDEAGVCLLGFESDAGVKRNKGRVGAKHAPDAIRSALANMAWHQSRSIVDLGNVVCENDELEASQMLCAEVIACGLKTAPVITLGGGHEVAWASFQGLAKLLQEQQEQQEHPEPPVVGIINFDAHFDLRSFDLNNVENKAHSVLPSSGTPFNQIAQLCQQKGWPFQYACLGVSRASNTAALFQRADQLNVWYVEDRDLTSTQQLAQMTQLKQFISQCDRLYLTIDLDVFPAATAPGVSAPAARGVSYEAIAPFMDEILSQKQKLILADIAEYNPDFDIDNQTARLAARLCWDIANSLSESELYKK